MCVGWGGQAKTVQNPHSPTPTLIPSFAFPSFPFIFFFLLVIFFTVASQAPPPRQKGGFHSMQHQPHLPFPFFLSFLFSPLPFFSIFPSPKQYKLTTTSYKATQFCRLQLAKRGKLFNFNHLNIIPFSLNGNG